jgi:hypothetical protein
MYNIEEIKLQNMQDHFSKMYLDLAEAIMVSCGIKGEEIIRKAVEKLGEDCGHEILNKHISDGIDTNIKNLFLEERFTKKDPRVRANYIKTDSQVCLWEVYSCPMADMWNSVPGGSKLGSFFCEEYTHALVRAYTEGKGQANLSDILTNKTDNHCRFSVYHRPANLTPEQKIRCFGKGIECKNQTCSEEEFKKNMNKMFIKLYYYLLDEAVELDGNNGACAIAAGLRELTCDTAEAIRLKADHTGKPIDMEFMNKNFPLNIDVNNEPLWKQYSSHEAGKIMDVNFLRPLKNQLGL